MGVKEQDLGKAPPDSSQLSAYLVAEASVYSANSENLCQANPATEELSSLISPVEKTPGKWELSGWAKGSGKEALADATEDRYGNCHRMCRLSFAKVRLPSPIWVS